MLSLIWTGVQRLLLCINCANSIETLHDWRWSQYKSTRERTNQSWPQCSLRLDQMFLQLCFSAAVFQANGPVIWLLSVPVIWEVFRASSYAHHNISAANITLAHIRTLKKSLFINSPQPTRVLKVNVSVGQTGSGGIVSTICSVSLLSSGTLALTLTLALVHHWHHLHWYTTDTGTPLLSSPLVHLHWSSQQIVSGCNCNLAYISACNWTKSIA